MAHSCNTSAWKAETGRSQVRGQSGLYTESLTPNLKTAGLERGVSERQPAVQTQGPECGPQDTRESQAQRDRHTCNHSTGPGQRQVDLGAHWPAFIVKDSAKKKNPKNTKSQCGGGTRL